MEQKGRLGRMVGQHMRTLDRGRVLGRRLLNFGPRGVLQRVSRKIAQRGGEFFEWSELDFPLRPEDIQSLHIAEPKKPLAAGEGKLRVAWVCTPPGVGSGGHTTLFRMVKAMEAKGHECTLLLYDRNSDDVSRHESLIRANWPQLEARVASVTTMTEEFDAIVASSWVTAHVIAQRLPEQIQRFYFIQDYEPFFYPRGYLYVLAEMTYKFGFQNMALGKMVGNELRLQCNLEPDLVVPFGCDTDVYRLIPRSSNRNSRSGIVYYAKREVDRRGYALAKAALERFHEIRPEQEIHIVGEHVHGWKAPVINHGSMRPTALNDLYNKTIAGLAMSFTNISLVPGELLAAGNIPVLNFDAHAQLEMPSRWVKWAEPHPEALARILAEAVDHDDVDARAVEAAADAPPSWRDSQDAVSGFIETQSYQKKPLGADDSLSRGSST